MKQPVVLGIETSCDETAAALLIEGRIVADCTTTQLLHKEYGGVVPELASRAHERLLMSAVQEVLDEAKITVKDIGAVAVTRGPGLAGALLVGMSFAKGLVTARQIPFIGVNHLEGHLWGAEITHGKLPLPFLGMIISGGHTMTVGVNGLGRYEKLGETHDDAAGELLDKVGRMMGYGFPAGESLDRDAMSCQPTPRHYDTTTPALRFPRARIKGDPLGFSFSGLKTAVLYYLREKYERRAIGYMIPDAERIGISTAIMEAVSDMLINGLATAWETDDYRALVVSGGVASSRYLRIRLEQFAAENDIPLLIPPPRHCTDNGAMIAYTGYLRLQAGFTSKLDLSIDPSASLW
ncbi:tRNA (adenosine(37)-N6)-threonylcarbamoyltransferase complex transferase subunit TsaD [bacterium]|nr:tRNA (adenosine(37)-N6)-threonylcarbamoyltransferase complex transferase subunit TsaD [bacterium]